MESRGLVLTLQSTETVYINVAFAKQVGLLPEYRCAFGVGETGWANV